MKPAQTMVLGLHPMDAAVCRDTWDPVCDIIITDADHCAAPTHQ